MRTTSRAIIIQDKKLLVIVRERFDNQLGLLKYYAIPGGGIEAGEGSEQAVIRELHEELLVSARVERYLGVVRLEGEAWGERRYQPRTHYFYLCSGVEGLPVVSPAAPEITSRLPGDLRFEAAWVPIMTPLAQFHPDYAPVIAWLQIHASELQSIQPFEIDSKARYTTRK